MKTVKTSEMPGPVGVYIQREVFDPERYGLQLFVYEIDARRRWLVKDVILEESPDGFFAPQPPIQIMQQSAQDLFDELWRLGLRPSRSADDPDATKAHLAHITRLLDVVLTKALR